MLVRFARPGFTSKTEVTSTCGFPRRGVIPIIGSGAILTVLPTGLTTRRIREVSTFPHHLHCGSDDNVVESRISTDPEIAVAGVLEFVSRRLREG